MALMVLTASRILPVTSKMFMPLSLALTRGLHKTHGQTHEMNLFWERMMRGFGTQRRSGQWPPAKVLQPQRTRFGGGLTRTRRYLYTDMMGAVREETRHPCPFDQICDITHPQLSPQQTQLK